MRLHKRKSAIKVAGIGEYVANKTMRAKAIFTITPDGSFYFVEGERIGEAEFNKKYPLTLKPIAFKGENQDRSKNWINDEPCY